MIWIDSPTMNPDIIALEAEFVIHPSLASPAVANAISLDPPNIAYLTSASGAACRPISAGTPATDV